MAVHIDCHALLQKLRPQDAMSEIDFTQAVMQMRRRSLVKNRLNSTLNYRDLHL
jgi:hypothetical protein